jgi:stress response protein YsnF
VDIDQRASEWKRQGWKGRFEADTSTTPSAENERTVPVTEEELVVGRRNVERGAVRVYSRVSEQPGDVEKRARVVEEVKVGKKRSKTARTVQDTVRKTDVEVERVGASNQAAYHGPERRRNTTPYTGQDRRKAA